MASKNWDEWDNEDRTRYYGKRKGDIIKVMSLNGTVWGESEVLDYVAGDNNAILIKSKNGNPIEWVAEWCDIITKIEDRNLNKTKMNTATTATNAPAETPKTDLATTKPQISQSERFTNAVVKEFSSNNGSVTLTPFQKKLCQNYFIKVDQTLKDNEKKRMAKAPDKRDVLAFTWENVNMSKLAVDVIAYSSVELDPTQPNHISIIPYKNTANNKFDMGFVIGYRGMEIKAKKYGLEVPSDVVCELVYSTDKFKQFKKDANNPVESYTLEITNDFDRGDVVGGFWYHEFKDSPEKNKIKVFSLRDIEKRKPKYASAEFWGGLKDVWEYDQSKGKNVKTGTEKIDGWFEEMQSKLFQEMLTTQLLSIVKRLMIIIWLSYKRKMK